MPPSTVSSPSAVRRWARDAVAQFNAIRRAESTLAALRSIPAGDPAEERLAVLAETYRELSLPSPSYSPDMDDDLKALARTLPGDLYVAFSGLAAALEFEIVRAMADGGRVPSVVAPADFGPSGLLYVLGRADPFVFLPGVKGHASGVSGTGLEEPVSIRGLASALPAGHPLLEMLPASQRLHTSAGPAFLLGHGVRVLEAGRMPYGKSRNFYFADDICRLTAEARGRQVTAERQKSERESWEQAQRRNNATLAKTPEQLRAEEELADLRRQVADLKKEKGGAGQ